MKKKKYFYKRNYTLDNNFSFEHLFVDDRACSSKTMVRGAAKSRGARIESVGSSTSITHKRLQVTVLSLAKLFHVQITATADDPAQITKWKSPRRAVDNF